MPTTPADRAGARVDCFPAHAAFPKWQEGRHPHCHFRGLLRLYSRYGPPDRSAAQGDLCREAPTQPVTRPSRSPASGPNRQLSGWNPPPLMIRAFRAHCHLGLMHRTKLRERVAELRWRAESCPPSHLRDRPTCSDHLKTRRGVANSVSQGSADDKRARRLRARPGPDRLMWVATVVGREHEVTYQPHSGLACQVHPEPSGPPRVCQNGFGERHPTRDVRREGIGGGSAFWERRPFLPPR